MRPCNDDCANDFIEGQAYCTLHNRTEEEAIKSLQPPQHSIVNYEVPRRLHPTVTKTGTVLKESR